MATALNNLAEVYRAQGRYAEAGPLYERSLAIREKNRGPDHPNVATVLNNLAALHEARGRYAVAEPLYKRSLSIKEQALGPDHPRVAAGPASRSASRPTVWMTPRSWGPGCGAVSGAVSLPWSRSRC